MTSDDQTARYLLSTPEQAAAQLRSAGYGDEAEGMVQRYLDANTAKYGAPAGGWMLDDEDLAAAQQFAPSVETNDQTIERLAALGGDRTDRQTRLMDTLRDRQQAEARHDERTREWRESDEQAGDLDAETLTRDEADDRLQQRDDEERAAAQWSETDGAPMSRGEWEARMNADMEADMSRDREAMLTAAREDPTAENIAAAREAVARERADVVREGAGGLVEDALDRAAADLDALESGREASRGGAGGADGSGYGTREALDNGRAHGSGAGGAGEGHPQTAAETGTANDRAREVADADAGCAVECAAAAAAAETSSSAGDAGPADSAGDAGVAASGADTDGA